jgi:hypothetical protein
MKKAANHFRKKHYSVKDVSDTEGYDLLCVKQGVELHVEVKGTTSAGDSVFLTANEAALARSKTNTALYVFHSITTENGKLSGGTECVINPWDAKGKFIPVSYKYVIEG